MGSSAEDADVRRIAPIDNDTEVMSIKSEITFFSECIDWN